MRRRALLPAAAAVCCVALGTAGCAAVPPATLDRASVQAHISSWIAGRYHVATPPVTCPAGVAGQPGTRFTCATTLAGTPVTVTGTVAGAGGKFRIALDRAVIDQDQARRLLAMQLRTPGTTPSVDCGPDRVRVMAPGGTFTCTATAGGVTMIVTGTASDLRGDVSFSVPPSRR